MDWPLTTKSTGNSLKTGLHRFGLHHGCLWCGPARHCPEAVDDGVFSIRLARTAAVGVQRRAVGLCCSGAYGLRTTLEGRIAITWFALLWILSVVHLVEGLRFIPVLSLLSYTLYSMALHAFHVPLAVLVAWWWSPHTALTPVDEKPVKPWILPRPVSLTMVVPLFLVP